jgi:DNA-binding FadR family transcriptional regulator
MLSSAPSTSDGPARPIERGAKIAEYLAQAIVHEIVSKKLPPGTRLPSEAQMIEDYGVGRGSLREALRILEVHGIIALKPGPNGGPVVVDTDVRDFGRMSSLFFHLTGATFNHLLEARLALEPLMARLAAEQRAQALVGRIADPKATEVTDDEAFNDATKDFHAAVASMSDNPVLNLFGASLEALFRDQVITGLLAPSDQREDVLAVHAAIAKAIAGGKADRAERLMRDHMQQYADWVRESNAANLDKVIDWR